MTTMVTYNKVARKDPVSSVKCCSIAFNLQVFWHFYTNENIYLNMEKVLLNSQFIYKSQLGELAWKETTYITHFFSWTHGLLDPCSQFISKSQLRIGMKGNYIFTHFFMWTHGLLDPCSQFISKSQLRIGMKGNHIYHTFFLVDPWNFGPMLKIYF